MTKLFNITIRTNGVAQTIFEYGETALQALSLVYTRFPDAELINYSYTKQYKKIEPLEYCRICNKFNCLYTCKNETK